MTDRESSGKTGFFFPVYGFEHQRYLENRIRLMDDKAWHVVCLSRERGSSWSLPSGNVSILCPTVFAFRILNKIVSLARDALLRLRGIRSHALMPPVGWKRNMRRIIADNDIRAFIVFYGGSAPLVRELFVRAHIPFAIVFEGSDFQVSDRSRWYRRQLDLSCARALRCVFVSRFLSRQATDRGLPADKAVIALNGTAIPAEIPVWRFSIPVHLVSIGNLFPVKGHEYVIDGFHAALEVFSDMDLTIIGGGFLEGALRTRINRLGMDSRVRLTGALPWKEAQAILTAAHIFILASVRSGDGQEEALGLAAIEAQALAKPCIVSDSGGLSEVVEEGVTGLVVPQRNADAVAGAILALVTDSGRLSAMSTRAAERAARIFSIEAQAAVLKEVRDELLAAGRKE